MASNDTPKCLCSIGSVNCSGYFSCSVRMAAMVSGESLVRGLQASEASLALTSALRICQASFVGAADVDESVLDVRAALVLCEVVGSVDSPVLDSVMFDGSGAVLVAESFGRILDSTAAFSGCLPSATD